MTDLFTLMQNLPTAMWTALAVTITGLALLIWAIVGLDRAQGRREEQEDQARVVELTQFGKQRATASKAGRGPNKAA